MPTVQIDDNWMSWALHAAGIIILFLLSLGVKDLRDRLKNAEQLCSRLELLEGRINDLKERLDARNHD